MSLLLWLTEVYVMSHFKKCILLLLNYNENKKMPYFCRSVENFQQNF